MAYVNDMKNWHVKCHVTSDLDYQILLSIEKVDCYLNCNLSEPIGLTHCYEEIMLLEVLFFLFFSLYVCIVVVFALSGYQCHLCLKWFPCNGTIWIPMSTVSEVVSM
jgi:hypothetical protein